MDGVRRAFGRRVLGRVTADKVTEARTQAQPVQHVGGEPSEQHAFLQVHCVGITVPAARVDLDRNGEPVHARRLFHGIRRQMRDFQAGGFLGELPPQRRLQAGVARLAAAAQEGEHSWLPDALALIPQMKQIAAEVVVFTDHECDQVGSELG